MTSEKWLLLAQSDAVRNRIAEEAGIDDFQAIIRVVAKFRSLDWDIAVAVLHMVYGWMPTMLRTIGPHTSHQRANLLATLVRARDGAVLNASELADVKFFANSSIVGASKILHVLNPANYPIWDSRVAEVFMWKGVTQQTFSTLDRYVEYRDALRLWVRDASVQRKCQEIRGTHQFLADASDLRLLELVLFRAKA
jgi:hypothetical protein